MINATSKDLNDTVEGMTSKASRAVNNLYAVASDEISHATDTVKSQIHSNPVQSSFIALAAGFILGALIRR